MTDTSNNVSNARINFEPLPEQGHHHSSSTASIDPAKINDYSEYIEMARESRSDTEKLRKG